MGTFDSPNRGYLLGSASGVGTGLGGQDVSGLDYSRGMVSWIHSATTSSANSASLGATLYGKAHNDMQWLPISSWDFVGPANSGSAIISAAYGVLRAAVNYVSGAGTGRMTLYGIWTK